MYLPAEECEFDRNEIEGNVSGAQRSILLFTNTDTGALNWSLTKNASWITTDITNGTTQGVLKISVNTSSLQHGTYNGNVVLHSPLSTAADVIISVTLIINPDVPVTITTWKDGSSGAMSVSVDDSYGSGFAALQANGFSGTYAMWDLTPPSYYTDYYNAGMELGCHTVNHPCFSVSDSRLRITELEPNISGLCTNTPEPCKDVITFVWPCGYTNYREQAIASEYFLSSRGYNINQLEDPDPENFMNLKSYNSHEHTPVPPSDLKTVVDLAVSQKKWFNLVLHSQSNDDGATNYASTKNIWVTSIGNVIKYILQRQRFILTDYNTGADNITYKVSRLSIPATTYRSFEDAFGPNDLSTMKIDIDDSRTIGNVFIDGVPNPFTTLNINGNMVLLTDVRLSATNTKVVEIRYLNSGTVNLTISGVTAGNKVYDATATATLNTGSALLVGVQAGDDVSLVNSGAVGVFTSKNVGVNKTVMTSGFTLAGADAAKYYLIQPSPSADVTPVGLTISGVIANNKVYDGNTLVTLNTGSAALSGVKSGDAVTLVTAGATGTFENAMSGTAKIVYTSGFTITGTDAGNYTLSQPVASANITQAPLTVSGVNANNKTYDGTAAAVLNTSGAILTVIYGSDNVSLISSNASGTFSDKNAGTGKVVTTSGFAIGGEDASDYTLTQPSLIASILPKTLTIIANDIYKPFKTVLTFTGSEYTYQGLVAGDVLPTFTISSPGSAMASPPGQYVITVSGGSAPNYTIVYVNGTLSVTKYILTAKADDKSKLYGSYNSPLTITYKGFVNGDTPSVLDAQPSASTAALPTSNPGIYEITLSDGADDLYDLKLENGRLEIQKAILTVTADNKTKIYGEANPELTVSYSGFLPGQGKSSLDVLPVVQSDVDENSDAGDYVINVSGGSDDDYSFIHEDGNFTVEKADQVITFNTITESLRMTQQVTLQASSSCSLPVGFTLSDPGKATLIGDVLTLKEDGKLTISAVQDGDHNHNPAQNVLQTIEIQPTFHNISSLFTPNGDGMNDYWYIPDLEEYGNIKVTVYNRFGQPVYESYSYKNDWDGTWNGYPLPSASYYYIITTQKKGFIKGVVNIVR